MVAPHCPGRIIDLHRRHRTAARRSLDREQPLVAAGDENHSSPDHAARLVDPEPTPAAASLRKELEGRFLLALEQMEEGDRDLLLMRHFEGLTNGEVAELLGLSPSAAGMRHLRALRRLRVVLGEAGSADGVRAGRKMGLQAPGVPTDRGVRCLTKKGRRVAHSRV